MGASDLFFIDFDFAVLELKFDAAGCAGDEKCLEVDAHVADVGLLLLV